MEKKYRVLAEHYAKAITRGSLRKGERLPSLREIAALHRVSISTAVEACRLLERQGYVEAKARAGYFVIDQMRPAKRAGATPPSDFDGVDERIDPADYVGVHERISVTLARGTQQPMKLDLAGAVCAPELYPGAALRDNMLRLLRARPRVYGTHPQREGVSKLREAIARCLVNRGMHADPETILITHGCSEALSLALMAVTNPGDVVAIESPTYFGILQIIESLGLKAIEIPTRPDTGISLDALEFAIAHMGRIQAVVCMPSVQNPLGCSMPDTAKARLADLCDKHNIALIEDDTYGIFLPNPAYSKPLKTWDKKGNVIYCNSLNKSLSPGLRVGWLVGGKWHKKIEMLMYAVSRHREEMLQLVVADFMAGGAYNRHIRRMTGLLKRQRTQFVEAILGHFPAGTEVTCPDAGLLLWVRLPDERNTDVLFENSLREGIRICPGSIFSNTDKFNDCLRLSCGMPITSRVESAIRTLGRLAREL
jgi:DNA-binding transcriptional MocR family regulator